MPELGIQHQVRLAPYTTLRAGGPAERFVIVRHVDEFAVASILAQGSGLPMTVLGLGSNVLPADQGVTGLVVVNRTSSLSVSSDGEVIVDTGVALQDLFLKTAQSGLAGLEFAVGIPGTVGGALASNAGAYRNNISTHITEVEVVRDGFRAWEPALCMRFSYRDSVLRDPCHPPMTVLRIRMKLPKGDPKQIYDHARDFQRQRIGKQPPSASAGSFFKNVQDPILAQSVEGLSDGMRSSGVVPAGFLLEACGMKGFGHHGAAFGSRHANFILNIGGASAQQIRELAEIGKDRVLNRFGVVLEEEVLYIGDWAESLS